MKSKILLVGILIAVLLLTGCVMTFNLCNWSSSNTGFNNLINTLNTPEKAINWLRDNCNYVKHSTAYSPYQVYAYKKYVCADASAFGRYAAHKHGYTSYDLILQFSDYNKTHSIAIYKVDGTYDNSSNDNYYDWNDSSLWAAANHTANDYTAHTVKSWYVNDYCNNVVDFKGITTKSIIYPIEGLYGTDTSSFIGEEAKNRAGLISGDRTIVNKGNPAQYSGTLENVGIWAYNTLYNVKVATFYSGDNNWNPDCDFYPDEIIDFEDMMIFSLAYGTTPGDNNWNPDCDLYPDGIIDFEDMMIFSLAYGSTSGGTLSTRDYESIGTVYGGSMEEHIVNLDVQEGDFIGIYFTNSQSLIGRDTSGYDGLLYRDIDGIPCTDLGFKLIDGDAISLCGFIITPN